MAFKLRAQVVLEGVQFVGIIGSEHGARMELEELRRHRLDLHSLLLTSCHHLGLERLREADTLRALGCRNLEVGGSRVACSELWEELWVIHEGRRRRELPVRDLLRDHVNVASFPPRVRIFTPTENTLST